MDRPTRLAFVDTETTGLSHLARPWEIAVIIREPGKQDAEHLLQVEYTPQTLPDGTEPVALQIGGWNDRFWNGGEDRDGVHGWPYRERLIDQGVDTAAGPEWSIARSLHQLLAGAVLIGVGVHYDAAVVSRMLLRHGLPEQPWHYDIRDLKTMSRGYLRGLLHVAGGSSQQPNDYQWASSDQLATWVGVTPPTEDERHTALGDARWAVRWWDAL